MRTQGYHCPQNQYVLAERNTTDKGKTASKSTNYCENFNTADFGVDFRPMMRYKPDQARKQTVVEIIQRQSIALLWTVNDSFLKHGSGVRKRIDWQLPLKSFDLSGLLFIINPIMCLVPLQLISLFLNVILSCSCLDHFIRDIHSLEWSQHRKLVA